MQQHFFLEDLTGAAWLKPTAAIASAIEAMMILSMFFPFCLKVVDEVENFKRKEVHAGCGYCKRSPADLIAPGI